MILLQIFYSFYQGQEFYVSSTATALCAPDRCVRKIQTLFYTEFAISPSVKVLVHPSWGHGDTDDRTFTSWFALSVSVFLSIGHCEDWNMFLTLSKHLFSFLKPKLG